MNEEKHWDNIGRAYDSQIFDVFTSDRKKILPGFFKKHARKSGTAIDFGCGTGKSFQYIAPLFKQVVGVDISNELLSQAAKRQYKNVLLKQMDLTKPRLSLPKADFAFCCNVAMLPEIEKTHTIIRNIQRALKPGGTALFVLPALDSVLYAAWRLIEVYKREGVAIDNIPDSEFDYFKATKRRLLEGIIYIDNVPTKHFMRSELDVVFSNAGFTLTQVEKVEYDWNTELSSPPRWLKDPYPWDWLVECKKDT
ncbi:MAG TPA: methyltransferase domain-containing protein [Cyclobacteriaceae bacterium]|nr:methyltransferase domain-containing protein [Cyclobacteriaceae bacterium]HMV09510.1 methyltransferase domain-containing protein [Cyclobacteriaceae bacterium]HMV91536.1 methyltransferase domain-containing protein [Cyclobacteriaceae bacterium]HMX02657.1 methyltransferase domain-containing protein [Cyclobacteriaceae bacterium]HMX51620.1 methyltransferase domain-containing protein [Cyclobacteriaceae bacterium]